MTQCSYSHIPDLLADPDDHYERCETMAAFTCCDFGGPVCEKHRCRCSKPLVVQTPSADESIDLGACIMALEILGDLDG